ncbi:hypothetical protein V8D89_005662 [Ganoderma adspersum]
MSSWDASPPHILAGGGGDGAAGHLAIDTVWRRRSLLVIISPSFSSFSSLWRVQRRDGTSRSMADPPPPIPYKVSAAPSIISPPRSGSRRSRRVLLGLPPSPRITSQCRRRGGRANALPIQSPVGDRRLGLCGVDASHCKAEPLTACTGIFKTGRE